GQGLSIGVGHALAARVDGKDYHTYVLTGDGELGQGQVWEAAASAGKFKLDTLTVFIDRNHYQQTGAAEDVLNMDPIDGKFDAFGRALEALGAGHPDLVLVDADVSNSTRTEWFGKKYPGRFFNIGIAESNLVGIAGGLASAGKTSLIASFAAFITCNAFDQLRMAVAYPHLNVKVVGSHAGISIGEDGASQMGIEDVSLACSLPGFTVIVPADEATAAAATVAMLEYRGPVYLRVGRPEV